MDDKSEDQPQTSRSIDPITIPAIPDSRIAFGEDSWIAVRVAYEKLTHVLALEWVTHRRNAMFKKQPVMLASCEICAQPVDAGIHYTRGWLKWMHFECFDRAKEFVAVIQKHSEI